MTAAKTFVAGSVMCLLALAGTSAQAQTFSDPVTYTLESENPGRAATGDLDGDGDADIAVPTYVSGSPGYVEVLLDLGGGSSAVPTVYDVGNDPRSVAAADLDGDGDLDLAVANRGDGTVSVLTNRGDGTFEAAVDHAAGSYPFVVVAGDLNADGLADLAVADQADVHWLANNGDGTFAYAGFYPFIDIMVGLDIGEMEGDTDLDLIVLQKSPGESSLEAWVTVLRNDGFGTFESSPRYDGGSWLDGTDYDLHPSVDSLALGDLNGNGYLDVLIGANTGWSTLPHDGSPLGRVNVLTNSAGDLDPPETRGTCDDDSPQLDTGDLDGDSDLDVVTNSVFFLNDGSGYFGEPQSHGGEGKYVTVDDLYPDGLPDLVLPQDPYSVRVVFQGDVCPSDPNKTAPGQCGCGQPDTDSDADGVADCNDECPGEPDTDSDGDRVVDCLDLCPDDPSKVDPGLCGCGSPDVDSDGDGVLDCDDPCPDDPDKIDPGVCGCGIEDVDSDGDGVADCIDQCPGEPDTDSDGDGVADCVDQCGGFDDTLDCNGNGVPDGCDIEGGPFEYRYKLTDDDGGAPNDQFGTNVKIDGDVFVVGAPTNVEGGIGPGSVYVYRNDGSGHWGLEQQLTNDDLEEDDYFGRYLSIHGDTIAVGAWGDDDRGDNAGAVYVYRYDGSGAWDLEQKLTASDGDAGDEFGEDVAIHGDTIAIGAWADEDRGIESGSVYVFRRETGVWVQKQKLTAFDGAPYDRFGYRVSITGDTIHGDTIVVGAVQDQDLGYLSGSVYVYRYDGSGAWDLEQKLNASDGQTWDIFGLGVSIYRDTVHGEKIVVAAPYKDDPVLGTQAGAVYVFRHDPTRSEGDRWVEEQKLTATDGAEGDYFGEGVSIHGDTIAIGAWADDDPVLGTDAGSVYVFRYDPTRSEGDRWVERQKLKDPDGAIGDWLGYGVAVDGGTIVAGSNGRDDRGTDSGAVYTFERLVTSSDCDLDGVPDECQPDTDLDGLIDVCDDDDDGDGTPDLDDGCPLDADKIDPGVCGCGVPDTGTDSDGDGVVDCVDQCPGQPDNPLVFTIDGCPDDPGKIYPGVCGCGVPDTDADGDGVADCVDQCPGQPDTDTDGDGVADCVDECPAGIGDPVVFILDLCPNDPNKFDPGQCGCGQPETDLDGDGYYCAGDCNDASPESWATPGEVAGLQFGAGTKDDLSWDAPAEPGCSAPRYDTVRSDFADDFGAATCIESGDGSDRSATDLANPASGSVFHYLVRAANDCPAGQGTLGHDSQGAERSAPICP